MTAGELYAEAGDPVAVAEAVARRCAACKADDAHCDEMGVYCGRCGEYAK